MVPSTDGLRLGPCWQVQTAALQVALQLLSTLQPARLPFHSLLDAAIRALQSWVDHDGAFMDHPLYPAWSQRLLAVLHILWKASWPWGAQDIARQKITKASRHPICLQMHSYRQQAYTAVLVQHCCCFSQEVFVRCSLRVPWLYALGDMRCAARPGTQRTCACLLQVLPQTILACAKDGAFRLQLCKLLLDCAGACPEGCAALCAVLPMMRESSRAARCLARGLCSALASSAPSEIPADESGRSEAQVGLTMSDALLSASSRDAQPCFMLSGFFASGKG